jgi:hypothetical protein
MSLQAEMNAATTGPGHNQLLPQPATNPKTGINQIIQYTSRILEECFNSGQ